MERSDISPVSTTTPGQRNVARPFPEKGQSISGEHLGVNVVVNHEGLPEETRASVWTELNLLEDKSVYFLIFLK